MRGPIRLAILTVSDGVARGERRDESGDAIEAWAVERGHVLARRHQVLDDAPTIADFITVVCDSGDADLLLTTGGTGFTERDVTPEATLSVLKRMAPGIAETLRAAAAPRTRYAPLSRGVAGIRARTLVVNLPGSTAAVHDGLAVLDPLLGHAVQLLRGERTHDHG